MTRHQLNAWLHAPVVTALLACCPAAAPAEGKLNATAAAPVAPDCARDGRRLQYQPAGALGGKAFLVAWSDGGRQADDPTADICCARVDATTGKPLDPAGIRVCAAGDVQEWPAVASDGAGFLVVWQDLRNGRDYDVYAARVDPGGKVLDADGFLVAGGPGNQARPAVAFADGRYFVAWMDARQYPVYGLYGARVDPEGKVLDAGGVALDIEDPGRIAKATPPATSWLGDRHYWWERLASRFNPAMASDGKTCLVTCLRDVHSNRTAGYALRVDPATGRAIGEPVKLSGEPRAAVAACATPDGWVVAFDQWMGGWTPSPRLAAVRLTPALEPKDAIPQRIERGAPEPAFLLDVQKVLADGESDYHQGKGHFAFWQAAAAWTGREVLVAMDFGWRKRRTPAEVHTAIVAARFDCARGGFDSAPPRVIASASTAAGTSVRRPVLAAGPSGRCLLIYESDAGIDRHTIQARILTCE